MKYINWAVYYLCLYKNLTKSYHDVVNRFSILIPHNSDLEFRHSTINISHQVPSAIIYRNYIKDYLINPKILEIRDLILEFPYTNVEFNLHTSGSYEIYLLFIKQIAYRNKFVEFRKFEVPPKIFLTCMMFIKYNNFNKELDY